MLSFITFVRSLCLKVSTQLKSISWFAQLPALHCRAEWETQWLRQEINSAKQAARAVLPYKEW